MNYLTLYKELMLEILGDEAAWGLEEYVKARCTKAIKEAFIKIYDESQKQNIDSIEVGEFLVSAGFLDDNLKEAGWL